LNKIEHFYFRFVPESYRWLVSNGKIEKAHGVIAKIARINGKPVPDFSKFAEIVKAAESTSKEKKYTIVDIVRNRTLLKYTMLVAIGW